MAHIISYTFTSSSLPPSPDLASNYCFVGRLDQIWVEEGSLPWESRAQKEMNPSISVSSRHIKAEYHWEKSMRCIVKFKEDIIAK